MVNTSKDVPWYFPSPPSPLNPHCLEVLEKYSQIPPDQIDAHVANIRERAWSTCPYPCIGMWRFLDMSISLHPSYPKIISLLKDPAAQRTFLDLGCCLAQDVRKLVFDGIPGHNLYATDVEQKFLDIGYELFKDRNTLGLGGMFPSNILEASSALDDLEGKIDIIHAANLFHLFSWDEQLRICTRLTKILKPNPGSIIFGKQLGANKAQEVSKEEFGEKGERVFIHDMGSWERLWGLVGEETGSRWRVWGEREVGSGFGGMKWEGRGVGGCRWEVVML